MEVNRRKVLVCNCERTMRLDAKALGRACGSGDSPHVHNQLCRAEIGSFEDAVRGDDPVLVCCTQEAPLFSETLHEAGLETPLAFTNIRERAGWSADAEQATPKIAALIAEAALDIPAATTVTMTSGGSTLVLGRDETAIEAAKQLSGRLDVVVLLDRPDAVLPPRLADVPIFAGTVRAASGHLGAFSVTVDGYAPARPASRQALAFEEPRHGVTTDFDLILDLSGGAPLFPAPEKRDGYVRPDPDNPAAVQRALFDLVDMVGEFDKPRYVTYDAEICVHGRSGRTGCTNCLDNCPTSAITPNGDYVSIDPYVCGGCGNCASVCPTGAASYALSSGDTLYRRLRTLLGTYFGGGGTEAVLLVHDARHGEEMLDAIGRYTRGLPANVLPFAVNEVTQVGFDVLAVAAAYGAGRIVLLAPPTRRDELVALDGQVAIAEAVLAGLGYGAGRVAIVDEADPEAVVGRLYELGSADTMSPASFLPMGDKRAVTMLALHHLRAQAPEPRDEVALPAGAPFGQVVVDTAGCTLCLACVGACPTGALIDNPDSPMLRFQEEACVQCGLCRSTCPESVISLEPRLNLREEARQAIMVKEEQPFTCVRCGKPFGARSSIERMVERLGGHAMFAGDARALERLKMCEDCRVIDAFEGPQPMAAGPRRATRTTDDELRHRDTGPHDDE